MPASICFGSPTSFISVQTLLPALLLVIVGEVARIRGSLYYVVGGGAALAMVPLMARLGQPLTVLDLSPVVWQVLATAGFAGWLRLLADRRPQRLIAGGGPKNPLSILGKAR